MPGPCARTARLGLGAATALGCLAIPLALAPASEARIVSVVPSASTFHVDVRGNGHGHGMSQYGAQGAALAGLGYRRILAFYYPHTKRVALRHPSIRVLISGTGSATTVAAAPGLTVTGVSGMLPSAGVRKYRLKAGPASTLVLQQLKGSTWTRFGPGTLPGRADFARAGGNVQVYLAYGGSTAYRGHVRAVRTGGGVITVNRLSLDHYTQGVVPREIPASWRPAAVRAQAVAARTYGEYAVEHPMNSAYDICDSTQCQVYGGAAHYAADGSTLYVDDPAALIGNSNTVLDYAGKAAFTQFSASNGGWSVAGGQPYLAARVDRYDDRASGDPYLSYTQSVSVRHVASYFRLATVTAIEITARDGNGVWGGRVTAGFVDGQDSRGNDRRLPVSGFDLQYAFGIGSTWFRIAPVHPPRGAIGTVAPAPGGLRVSGWAFDPDRAARPVRVYETVDGKPNSTRRTRLPRPNIQARVGARYSRLGFSRSFPAAPGRHRVCLHALDADGLGTVLVACKGVTLPS